jgi:FMN-dependent oxidoreductase (nitrilotriacetate monooxygenase family)
MGDSRHIVLGATVRALGAWPSGWRYPGAHRNPLDDKTALARAAIAAEDARLDFLFFGDWLATATEYEFTDAYLLARLEPLAAISYLAATTSRIGLVATVNSSHSEAYAVARSSASADLLSGGRVGLNIATGAEPRSAKNFGWDQVHSDSDRIEAAGELIELVRRLWDSWEDDAFVADVATGRLIDPRKIHATDFAGRHRNSAGPLNVLRPPQGHLPIALATGSPHARRLATQTADIMLSSPRTQQEAIDGYAEAKRDAAAAGRDPDEFIVLASILPIVGKTREEAWSVYDALVELVPLEGDLDVELPTNRSVRMLSSVLGVPVREVVFDDAVPIRTAGRFSELGRGLVRVVEERSGRTIGGDRAITFRHLAVAHSVVAPVIVGSAEDVADHLESWFSTKAVDGYTVLSAFLGEQFEAFTTLVVPELQRRGLFRSEYEGSSLREHLGLRRPENIHTTTLPFITLYQ